MINSIKRMVLTGAAVMVMMSFAAPAMANTVDPNAEYTQYTVGSSINPSSINPSLFNYDDGVPTGPAPTNVDDGSYRWHPGPSSPDGCPPQAYRLDPLTGTLQQIPCRYP